MLRMQHRFRARASSSGGIVTVESRIAPVCWVKAGKGMSICLVSRPTRHRSPNRVNVLRCRTERRS